MINIAGPYILVLMFKMGPAGGLAMQEFPNFESCKAAITQLEFDSNRKLWGYCIAKDVLSTELKSN